MNIPKCLYLTINITQKMADNYCTYDEAETILCSLQRWLSEYCERESKIYPHPEYNVSGEKVVTPLKYLGKT